MVKVRAPARCPRVGSFEFSRNDRRFSGAWSPNISYSRGDIAGTFGRKYTERETTSALLRLLSEPKTTEIQTDICISWAPFGAKNHILTTKKGCLNDSSFTKEGRGQTIHNFI